jgi:hypothetical protein
MTALRVNESSGSVGSVQVSDGYGGFLSGSLIPGTNVTIDNNLSGDFTINANVDANNLTIGDPEDSTYTDGLFTDFTANTRLGIAIDRFNEILALLAPSPAPNVNQIDVNTPSQGTDTYLSFGSSNDIEQSEGYYSVGNLTEYGSKDVNEIYEPDFSGNDIKLGVYNSKQQITGNVNESVQADGQNYIANAFGNADTGYLVLEVNNSIVHQVDLSSFVSGQSLDATTSSGFSSISEAFSGQLDNGTSFPNFKHRTAEYVISTSVQRQGWNYAKVYHQIGSLNYETNYVEWVVDEDSSQLTASNQGLLFSGNNSNVFLSGINYFDSATLQYRTKIDNLYQKVHDRNDVSFSYSLPTLNSNASISFSPIPKPTIDTVAGEDHTKSLHLTASSNVSADILVGDITVGVNATHPFKNNLINDGQAIAANALIYNLSNTSTNYTETFLRENYRLQSGNYNNQNDIPISSWDSTRHITGSNTGHTGGLQYFNRRLYAPINTYNGGDFSSLFNGPSNPDYSSENTGTKTFYRAFQNQEGQDVNNLKLVIYGTNTTIVSANSSLTGNNIKVSFKIPGKTAWLDIATNFTYQNTSTDGDGCQAITLDSSISSIATNYLTFGTVSLSQNEYIVIRIEALATWTGDINQINVELPGGTGQVNPVVYLTNIDMNNSGVTANLSFGPSKTITGYENVSNIAGYTVVDINEPYDTPANGKDYRRGVFDGTQDVVGTLNETVSAVNPDYPSDVFFNANLGQLILEVNNNEIHSVDLSIFGSGDTRQNNLSRFNLTSWSPALFDNNVPDYLNVYRQGTYTITPSDQQPGWNYARVIHRIGGSDTTTNYVEWVNDNESQNDDITFSDLEIESFTDQDTFYLSGVKYFTNPSTNIKAAIENIYKNIYSPDNDAIKLTNLSNLTANSIRQEGTGLAATKTSTGVSTSLQTLNSSLDSQNELLFLTGSLSFNKTKSLSGSFSSVTGFSTYDASGKIQIKHPLKHGGVLSSQTLIKENLLVFSSSDNSSNTNIYFNGEARRIQSGSYNNVSDISTLTWDSEIQMNNPNNQAYSTGLLLHDGLLISPIKAGNSGNFKNHDEGGVFEGPSGNADYSNLSESTREYFCYISNPTTNNLAQIGITFFGDAKLVGHTGPYAGTLGANKNFKAYLKVPGKLNYFVDLGNDFNQNAGNNTDETDGALNGSYTNSGIITSSGIEFETIFSQVVEGTGTGPDYIVIRIVADKEWTGYLSRIGIRWSVS